MEPHQSYYGAFPHGGGGAAPFPHVAAQAGFPGPFIQQAIYHVQPYPEPCPSATGTHGPAPGAGHQQPAGAGGRHSLDAAFGRHRDAIARVNRHILDDELVDAGGKLLEVTDQIVNWSDRGLRSIPGLSDMSDDSEQMWEWLNHAWLALFQRQLELTNAALAASALSALCAGGQVTHPESLGLLGSALLRFCTPQGDDHASQPPPASMDPRLAGPAPIDPRLTDPAPIDPRLFGPAPREDDGRLAWGRGLAEQLVALSDRPTAARPEPSLAAGRMGDVRVLLKRVVEMATAEVETAAHRPPPRPEASHGAPPRDASGLTDLQADLCWLGHLARALDQGGVHAGLLPKARVEEMAARLIRHCDALEGDGLVDYQRGMWEEQIVDILLKCADHKYFGGPRPAAEGAAPPPATSRKRKRGEGSTQSRS